jgi:hypothetical protein
VGKSERQEREKGWGRESERVGGKRRDRGGTEQPVCELKNTNDICMCVSLYVSYW